MLLDQEAAAVRVRPVRAIDERTRARHAAVHGLLRQGVAGDR